MDAFPSLMKTTSPPNKGQSYSNCALTILLVLITLQFMIYLAFSVTPKSLTAAAIGTTRTTTRSLSEVSGKDVVTKLDRDFLVSSHGVNPTLLYDSSGAVSRRHKHGLLHNSKLNNRNVSFHQTHNFSLVANGSQQMERDLATSVVNVSLHDHPYSPFKKSIFTSSELRQEKFTGMSENAVLKAEHTLTNLSKINISCIKIFELDKHNQRKHDKFVFDVLFSDFHLYLAT